MRTIKFILLVILACLLGCSIGYSEGVSGDFEGLYLKCSQSMFRMNDTVTWTISGRDSEQYTFDYKMLAQENDAADHTQFRLYDELTQYSGREISYTIRKDQKYVLWVEVYSGNSHAGTIISSVYHVVNESDHDNSQTLYGKVNEIVQACRDSGATTTVEIARFMHDYLINNADYDTNYQERFADGVLLKGRGVCQSYADAFNMLMWEMGEECDLVHGSIIEGGEEHVWNIVRVNGKWLHVDCTHDDPINGVEGHRYFLVTDEYMQESRTWENAMTPDADKTLEAITGYDVHFSSRDEFITGMTGCFDPQRDKYAFKAYLSAPECSCENVEAWLSAWYDGYYYEANGTIYAISGHTYDTQDAKNGIYVFSFISEAVGSLADFKYRVEDGVVFVSGYTGSAASVVVPSEIGGYPVVVVEDNCFYANHSMESLTIGEGVEAVYTNFAQSCSKLKSITLPSTVNLLSPFAHFGLTGFISSCSEMETISVADGNPYLYEVDNVLFNKQMTKILYYPTQKSDSIYKIPEGVQNIASEAVSYNSYLKEVVLPDSVTHIGLSAFQFCKSLEKVNIPRNCTSIAQFAFYNTNITEIHIPASVQGIGSPAFSAVLHTITVDENNTEYYAADNVLFSRDGALLCYAPGKTDEIFTVQSDVEQIASYAFHHAKKLKKVILPTGLTRIGFDAFSMCHGLTEMILPETITILEKDAFFDCKSLEKLVIPASLTSIPDDLLTNVKGTIIWSEAGSAAEAWAKKNGFAFIDVNSTENITGTYGDNITWILSQDGILHVGGTGEMNESIAVPWNKYANMIQKLIISEGITSVAPEAFFGCDYLTSIVLPESLKTIRYYAFGECSKLTEVYIPEYVVTLESAAFSDCTALRRIELPASLTDIGYSVFYGCENVEKVIARYEIGNDSYTMANLLIESANIKTAGPIGSGCDYEFACGNALPDKAFLGLDYFEQITIPEHVVSIGADAFYHCSALQKIEFPANLTDIGNKAFMYCGALSSVTLPDSITSIGKEAFQNCTNLESINLPSSITNIAENAFKGCTNLTATVFSGSYALAYCEENKIEVNCIQLPPAWAENATVWGSCGTSVDWALFEDGTLRVAGTGTIDDYSSNDAQPWSQYRKDILNVDINEGVTRVGVDAFAQCTSIRSVTLASTVYDIPPEAFDGCSNLEKVVAYCEISGDNPVARNVISTKPKIKTAGPIGSGCDFEFVSGDTLPSNAFAYAEYIEEIILPNNVTVIETDAMAYCTALRKVELPAGLMSIDFNTFCYSQNIDKLIMHGTIKDDTLMRGALSNLPKLKTAGPIGSGCNYEFTCGDAFPENAFNGLTSFEEIILPENVVSIGEYAFAFCSGLRRVEFPDSLKTVNGRAFTACVALEELVFPASLQEIGIYAIRNCKSLKSVIFLGELPEIDDFAFYDTSTAAFYPGCNITWTQSALQNYGGTLNWAASEAVHTEVILEAVAPGCTTTGLTEGKSCAVCDEVLIAQQVIPAQGHAISMGRTLYEITVGDELIIELSCFCEEAGVLNFEWASEFPDKLALCGISDQNNGRVCSAAIVKGKAAGIVNVSVTFNSNGMENRVCTVIVHSDMQLKLPEMLRRLEAKAFANSPVREVILPDGIEEIGSLAFADCRELAIICMPDSIERIEDNAFDGCENISFICSSDNKAAAYAKENSIRSIILQ